MTNAYTREYVFDSAYQYYGIRTSLISLAQSDADPELDAIAAFHSANRCDIDPNDPSCVQDVPAPGILSLMAAGVAGLFAVGKRRRTPS